MKCSLGISNRDLLKKSLVFPVLLFSSISLHWSLRKDFLSLLAILWNFTFKWVYLSFSPLPFTSLLFSDICKASSDPTLPFCFSFPWGWVLSPPPVQCREPLSVVLQALYQIPSLEFICHFHCITASSYLNGLVVFPTFFSFSLNLAIRSSWSVP